MRPAPRPAVRRADRRSLPRSEPPDMSDSTSSHSSEGRTPPQFQVAIRLEWDESDDVPIVYANQLQVSHGGPEFFLVFGVMVPPANPSDLPDVIRIRPQARVVVSREAMPAIVQALNDNLQRYREAQQGRGG
ncbi:hypothetical protein DCC79_01775 [bacterium]|nr:MAG: hypothetical protein DCC79_01775 [bacterium]